MKLTFIAQCELFWHINGNISKKEEKVRSRHFSQRRNSFALLPFWCEACDMNYFMFE